MTDHTPVNVDGKKISISDDKILWLLFVLGGFGIVVSIILPDLLGLGKPGFSKTQMLLATSGGLTLLLGILGLRCHTHYSGWDKRILKIIGFVLIGTGAIEIICREMMGDKWLNWDPVELRIGASISLGLGILFVCFRNKARVLIYVILVLITFLAGFVVAESVLRFAKFQPPKQALRIYTQNPNGTGSFKTKPNLDLTMQIGGETHYLKTNAQGMRWREVSSENPLNRTRIVFTGDSFTFGWWATRAENSFVGTVEALLDTTEYEVLNFGVSGYGLDDIALQIREDILPFGPDYLVVMFNNGNDFRDTYLGLNKYDVSTGFTVWNDEVIKTKIPEAFRQEPEVPAQFFTKFYVYQHLASRFSPATDFAIDNRFTRYTFWSQIPYPKIAIEAKDQSLNVLQKIQELCIQHGIQLVIVSIPYEEQVTIASPVGEHYDINLPQKYVQNFSKAHDVPYLDLLPLFRQGKKPIYYRSHFKNTGHRVVGQYIAEFLLKDVLAP